MVQTPTLRRRSWAGMAWLLAFIASLLVALVLGNTFVLLFTLVVAALVVVLMLGGQAATVVASPAISVDPTTAPRAQRDILAADGTARQALVVPAAAVDGYQAVLTIDGYALVNAEGRVVYALNRQSHEQVGDQPVVVTILGDDLEAEVAAR
jgi:hypothetical protein